MEKKKWVKHIPLFILEVLVLLVAAGVLFFTLRATDKKDGVKKIPLKEENIVVNEDVREKIENTAETEDSAYTGVFNVAFFGVDSRDGGLGKGNRSDTIMMCSVDMDTHEIRLISIYRDTYLNQGNDDYGKCNAAYAYGGPEQAISMINMNTDMYVTDYVTVGFEGLIEVVDALGGVEMEITDAEINHLNNYQSTMAEELGVNYTPVTESGKQLLNGLQATAYCRIRYTAGDDFKRAERQRNLLVAMLEKGKVSSLTTLTNAVNAVMPNVRTSLDINDILSMLGMIGDFKVTVSDGFPFNGLRNGGTIGTNGSCVVPVTLEDNVIKLHELLFADEAYEPSKEVKSFSEQIEADTEGKLQY